MDSNRLYPQPINLSTLGNSKNIPQKLTLRRRCRSECLQMAPINGGQSSSSSNDTKLYIVNDNNLTSTNDVRRKIAHQPNFRNTLMKYSSSTILRNQDSAKNIFSTTNNRKQNVSTSTSAVSVSAATARLKNTTKENISKSTSMLNGNNALTVNDSNHLTNHHQSPIIIDNNNYRRELCNATRSPNKRMINNSTQNNLNRISSDNNSYSDANKSMEIPQLNWKSSTSLNDINHKRRVRARSESESQDIYQITSSGNNKCSPQKNYKFRGYDVSFSNFFLIYFLFLLK